MADGQSWASRTRAHLVVLLQHLRHKQHESVTAEAERHMATASPRGAVGNEMPAV